MSSRSASAGRPRSTGPRSGRPSSGGKGDYGMLWPGAVYDGEAARGMYAAKIAETAARLGAELNLRARAALQPGRGTGLDRRGRSGEGRWPRAGHAGSAGARLADGAESGPERDPVDCLFAAGLVLHDQHRPIWPRRPGCVVYSTDDFSQAAYGMKMLCAAAKMRRTCCVVIQGDKRYDSTLADTGITLRHIPASSFIEEYRRTPDSEDIVTMADEYMSRARRRIDATRQDVINGLKSYYVAGKHARTRGRRRDHDGLPRGPGQDRREPAVHRVVADERRRHPGRLRGGCRGGRVARDGRSTCSTGRASSRTRWPIPPTTRSSAPTARARPG